VSSRAPRQIDYQRMIRALRAEGVAVDKCIPVVGVHGVALLPPGTSVAEVIGPEEARNPLDRVLRQ
jgi:hypothetical protein